jgi:NADH dehydrogenase FAD-containing subunit
MSAKKNDDRKVVAIVGGGSAGVNIARPLSAQLDATKYKLVLINPRPYRVLLPATLRMVVSDVDNLSSTALVPFDKLFHGDNGTFIQDSVTGFAGEDKTVLTLANGQQVPYDILVLASGRSWTDPIAFPNNPEAVQHYISRSHERFAAAKSYLLVGGGAVGSGAPFHKCWWMSHQFDLLQSLLGSSKIYGLYGLVAISMPLLG